MTGGFAFSRKEQGDLRRDQVKRASWAATLAAPAQWATVRQIHGSNVVRVTAPVPAGEADGLFTTTSGVGLAIFTADCAGVVLTGDSGVGVAHAGWRGAHRGVVAELFAAMQREGIVVTAAHIGPTIGPCCFEVGEDVAELFDEFLGTTTWGTTSVDLPRVIRTQLPGIEVVAEGGCTFHDAGYWSHRRDGATERMASLAWLEP